MKNILYALLGLICMSCGSTNKSETTETATVEAASGQKALVAYFSATGTTKAVAQEIAQAIGADLYEIAPDTPYTSDDLNWQNDQSRSSLEMKDPACRPALGGDDIDVSAYDIVFIGYPIWWDLAPRQVNTFIEKHDLAGKKLIPFATSGGSTIDNSAADLQRLYPTLNWSSPQLLNDGTEAAWALEAVTIDK